MKHTIFLLALLMAATLSAATSVTVENRHMVLTQDGATSILTPNGADESYYWVSLSPDGQQILYSTAHHGTCVCDLNGHILRSFGRLNAPKWMDNENVAGMQEVYKRNLSETATTEDYQEIDHIDFFCCNLSSMQRRALTPAETNLFVQQENARLAEAAQRHATRAAARRAGLQTMTDLTGLNIYINPGHGGHDANDRSCWTIPVPETWTNPNGYWESNSNLVKGLALRDLLQAAGANVIMSRTTNNSGSRDVDYYPGANADQLAALMAGDDRDLSAIAEEANANNVDHFISIHSNALNTQTNYLLMLYHGLNGQPTVATSDQMAQSSGNIQIQNPLTVWTSSSVMLRGDISFYGDDPNSPSAGLGVLRPLTVPGFLSEGSFHDYPPETHRLCNADYCKLEALRMYQHFHRYFGRQLPQTATISGFVKSSNEKVDVLGQPKFTYVPNSDDQWLPLNGAKVVLINADGLRIDSLLTDNWYNGIFAFYDLQPGTYTIEAGLEGYKTKTCQVTVAAEQIAGLKMQLKNTHLVLDDYTNPEQDGGTLPLEDVVFQTVGSQQNIPAIKRALYKNNHLLTLTDNGIQLRDWTFAQQAELPLPEGLLPTDLQDIAFTADGYLVASKSEPTGMSIYVWDDDFLHPTLLFTETGLGAPAGQTLTVSGSLFRANFYTLVGGVLFEVAYNEDTPQARTLTFKGNVAAGSRLIYTPNGEVYAANNGRIPAFFKYAGQSYMAMPVDTASNLGFRICDITNGLANAQPVSAIYASDNAAATGALLAYVDGYQIHIGVIGDQTQAAKYQRFESVVTPVANIYATEVSFDGNTFRFRLNENATSVTLAIEREGETRSTHELGALTKGAHEVANPFGTEGFDAFSISAVGRSVGYPVKISTDDPIFQFYAPRGVAVDRCPTSPYFGRVYVSESLGGQVSEGTAPSKRLTTTGVYALSADFTDITNQGTEAWNGGVEWGANNSGTQYQWSLARFAVAPSGKVFVTSTAFSSANVYIMDPANPANPFQPVFGGKRNTATGALKQSGATVCNPIMSCCVLGTGTDEVLYTMDRNNSMGTVFCNIQQYNIGQADSLPWKQAPSATVYDDALNNYFQNGSGEIQYDSHGGWWMSQYRYNSSAAIPSLVHITNGIVDYNCGAEIPTSQQGGMAVSADGSMVAIGRELGIVAVYDVNYNANNAPSLTEKYIIDWGGGKGNTMGVDFDAAGNLYIVSNSNERLMIYALPKPLNAYTTRVPYFMADTAIEELEQQSSTEKIIRDGQVLIIKNGRTYNLLGQQVR